MDEDQIRATLEEVNKSLNVALSAYRDLEAAKDKCRQATREECSAGNALRKATEDFAASVGKLPRYLKEEVVSQMRKLSGGAGK
jgi:hypothetical protein